MSNVDLSKAVKGSTLHFRCGGSAVVSGLDRYPNGVIELSFKEGWVLGFYKDGSFYEEKQFPLDIIRIDPPAFNWDDVRPGMAFLCEDAHQSELVYYVGPSLFSSEKVVTAVSPGTYIRYTLKCALTRAPEHDIEVKG